MTARPEVPWIWKDGEWVAWDDARIHVLSHAVQFGSSIFEGVRCYDTADGPAFFRLDDHLRRLRDSCRIYRTTLSFSTKQLERASAEVVRRNELGSCYLRPMVVRGYGAVGMVPGDSPVEMYLVAWPWGAYLGDGALENGVDACVSTWTRVAPNTVPALAKAAGNYLSSQLAKMEALANGYVEAICLGPDGLVSEGTGQNVFAVLDGTLVTAPLDGTLLAGITRDSVLTLANDERIPVRQGPLPRELLYTADELFFCGTASEVTPIRSVDRIPVGSGGRGPITGRLQERLLDVAHGRTPDVHGWLTHVGQPVSG